MMEHIEESSSTNDIKKSITTTMELDNIGPSNDQNSVNETNAAAPSVATDDGVASTLPNDREDEIIGKDDSIVTTGRKTKTSKKLRRIAILESDSESDIGETVTKDFDEEKVEESNKNVLQENENNIKKRLTIFDSDSDGTDNFDHITKTRVMKNITNLKTKKVQKYAIVDSDTDGETSNVPDKNRDNVENLIEVSRIAAICDSESSEDEHGYTNVCAEKVQSNQQTINKKSVIRPKKERPPKKMTAKDALKQRQEITSESQRMLRELPLALPYHKPKERSIKEFFQNRPRLSVIKNEPDLHASVAIKMTPKELQVVMKKMEDREKEVEKFYKSESEEEQDECSATSPMNVNEICDSEKSVAVKDVTISSKLDDCNSGSDHSKLDNCTINENVNTNQLDECKGSVDEGMDISESFFDTTINKLESNNEENEIDFENGVVGSSEMKHISDEVQSTELETTNHETMNLMQPCKENENQFSDLQISSDDLEKSVSDELNVLSDNCKSSISTKIVIHSVVSIPNAFNAMEESVDYDFNLDNLDEHIETDCTNKEEERLQNLVKKYNGENAKSEINRVSSFKQQLFKELANCKPCLKGDFDREIDFDDGIIKPNPIVELRERFVKHLTTKKVNKDKMKLDVINLSQGEIHKETLTIPVDSKESESIEMTSKPGIKFQKLRNELQERIAKERTDIWKQKDLALSTHETLDIGETTSKDGYEADEDILDDEEEEVISDEATDEEDIYDETDHVEEVKKKSAFLDDEAEVTDVDESEELDSGRSSKASNQPCEENSNKSDAIVVPKKLNRILKGFVEDSDDESLADLDLTTKEENSCKIRTGSVDIWDDDETIAPHQPRLDKTPHKEMMESKTDSSFLTPVMQLTGLQGLNSGSKYLHESPISPFNFPKATPSQNVLGVKQKLFGDSYDAVQIENLDDIAELCSGKFPSSNNSYVQKTELTTQDLLSICSGEFSGITNKKLGDHSDIDITSEKQESLVSSAIDEYTNLPTKIHTESRYLDEDKIISQLLNEEELEQFKKKFESPDETNLDIQGGGKLVFDSSDDEFSESNPKITKTLHKKLQFSDDESEEEVDNADIDLHDNVEEDEENLDEEGENNLKGYDSEENEIDHNSVHMEKTVPGDFLENEAELSESEWDSADEDERDLDVLEAEQGDAEVYDENKIRNDLEKIHMRRILDDDNREIKILQEMLLEDGELHGRGRERQFRWRNIDDNANDDGVPIDGNDVYLDEDESEEQWRRTRHQREMFLKSQQEKQSGESDLDSILSDSNSQVFKIGQEAFQRSLTNSSSHIEKNTSVAHSNTITSSSMFANTRGSFLARTDRFLTRLADITKVASTVNVVKTSKKIVFHTSSFTEENGDALNVNNKRKATDGTPVAIKKLRLSSNLSPSVKTSDKKKKLF
ncbi:hypothetical protein RI129_002500 [Pyrocoelia pectoralis]|uniref:Claspin n=1 Tax=Pyrocoelia pectoralis TaxID=417401 RepID=A0AAN7VMX2_9COLE